MRGVERATLQVIAAQAQLANRIAVATDDEREVIRVQLDRAARREVDRVRFNRRWVAALMSLVGVLLGIAMLTASDLGGLAWLTLGLAGIGWLTATSRHVARRRRSMM